MVVEQLRAAGILATNRAITGATWSANKAFGKFEAVVDWNACGSVNELWLSMNRYTQRFWRPVGDRLLVATTMSAGAEPTPIDTAKLWPKSG